MLVHDSNIQKVLETAWMLNTCVGTVSCFGISPIRCFQWSFQNPISDHELTIKRPLCIRWPLSSPISDHKETTKSPLNIEWPLSSPNIDHEKTLKSPLNIGWSFCGLFCNQQKTTFLRFPATGSFLFPSLLLVDFFVTTERPVAFMVDITGLLRGFFGVFSGFSKDQLPLS